MALQTITLFLGGEAWRRTWPRVRKRCEFSAHLEHGCGSKTVCEGQETKAAGSAKQFPKNMLWWCCSQNNDKFFLEHGDHSKSVCTGEISQPTGTASNFTSRSSRWAQTEKWSTISQMQFFGNQGWNIHSNLLVFRRNCVGNRLRASINSKNWGVSPVDANF